MSDDAMISSLEKLPVLTYIQGAALLHHLEKHVYDYALTFADELNLIWPARWNLGKVLFFLTRYPPFFGLSLPLYCISSAENAGLSSDGACAALRRIDGFIAFSGIIVAEVILAIRVFALWRGTPKAAAFIAVVSCTCIVGALVIFVVPLRRWDFIDLYQSSGQFGGCVLSSARESAFVYASVAVAHGMVAALELVLFVMTCMSGLLRCTRSPCSPASVFLRPEFSRPPRLSHIVCPNILQ
ncbi:hypothetical protein CPB85DRAFT_1279601 [Mucidula mucida]|nr:hypothetical protein CPB85DRAFT_1279601 [Mucidula mucida]